MKAFFYEKILICLVIVTLCFAVFVPRAAHAGTGLLQAGIGATAKVVGQVASAVPTTKDAAKKAVAALTPNLIGNVLYTVIGKIAFGVSAIIAGIIGVFIALEAWLIGFMLQINVGLVDSPTVTNGTSVTISLANLGFVLGIIVIAIATILRRETYGLKQTLWKLVVAALLVNFSLTIAGTILNFSDTLSTYFLNQVNPGQSFDKFSSFATDLAGAFNPQQGFLNVTTQDPGGGLSNAFASTGEDLGALIKPLVGVVAVLLSTLTIAITMAGMLVMLIIRYVLIGILLVLMPLAWVTWIFPLTAGNWTKWWRSFIRWSFFPPIMIFFIYLGLLVAKKMSDASVFPIAQYKSDSNAVWATVSNNFTGFLNQIAQPLFQTAIMVGIMGGGIFAANSLSIAGTGFMMNAAKGIKGAVTGYVGKQAKKGARNLYQRAGGEKLTQRMQTSRIPGVSIAGRAIATLTERGGKQLVEADMKEAASKDSKTLAIEAQGFMGMEKRLAYLTELQKRGDLDMIENIGGKSLGQFLKDNEKKFQQYGQTKLHDDLNKSMGADAAMREAAEQVAAGGAGAAAALVSIKGAAEKFAATLSSGDIQKGQIDSLFVDPSSNKGLATQKAYGISAGAHTRLQIESAGAISKSGSTQTLSSFHQKLAKGGSQAQFDQAMRIKVNETKNQLTAALGHAPTRDEVMNEMFSGPNRIWIESQAGQNLGIDPANWGIT